MKEKAYNSKKRKIFIRYFATLLVMLIVPSLILFFTSKYSYSLMLKNEQTNANKILINSIVDKTEHLIDTIKINANQMSYSNEILQLIADNNIPPTTSITQFINTMNCSEHINSVYVYSYIHNDIIDNNFNRQKLEDYYDKAWFDICNVNSSNNIQFLNRTITIDSVSVPILSVVKSITNDDELIGLIVINVNQYKLIKSYFSDELYKAELHINDDKGYEIISKTASVSTNSGIFPIIERTDKNNWQYSLAVHSSNTDSVAYSQNFLSLALLVYIIWAFIFVAYISKKIFQPINTIFDAIDNTNTLDIGTISNDEYNDFRYIAKKIQQNNLDKVNIESTLKESLDQLHKHQLISLRNQIKPHFLYNTLNSIRFSAMDLTDGENDVSKSITMLADLLRCSLNSSQLVSLETEINYIKLYIDLYKIRFNNKLTATYNIDPKTLNIKVIQFILQPIVENSITHGIKPKLTAGSITISTSINEHKLFITIEDDGIGISQEIIDDILSNTDKLLEHNHIGISNTIKRLQLLYGSEYSFTIDSTVGVGTKITISFPY